MPDIREQVANIAQDLVNLEVNTIIKPNISGSKMPRPRRALIDIGKEYVVKLGSMGLTVDLPKNAADERLYGSRGSFECTSACASKQIDALTARDNPDNPMSGAEEAQLFMLFRIRDMSDSIVEIFSALPGRERNAALQDNLLTLPEIEASPPLPLTQQEMLLLRKIWEVGTEEIAMQTVIQLDGDVVTRVIPKYAEGGHEVIHQIHQQGVQTSIGFWKDLISIAKDFLSSLFRLMSPAR